MMINPIQQQAQANASKAQPVNGFSKFHAEISKSIFNPTKYGVAISKKLLAVAKEGAIEHQEFATDLTEFTQEAMILVALASVAVGHKGVSPKDDAAVLMQLEALVVTANKFIPLIEKLYAAEEGVLPVEVPVEVKANATTIEEVIPEVKTETEIEPAATSRSTSTQRIADTVKKWSPAGNTSDTNKSS